MSQSQLAPITHSLEDRVETTPFNPMMVSANEILTLAEEMKHYGDEHLTDVVARLWDASLAIESAVATILEGQVDAIDLLTITPADLTKRVLASATNEAARLSLAYDRVRNQYDHAVVAAARVAMRDSADAVVAKMRPTFNKHAKVIRAAADAGLSKDTDPTDLLNTGTPDMVEAYRTLPASVTALDQLAALRHRITQYLGYGPLDWPVCAFIVASASTDLEDAADRYAGETEVRQYHQQFTGASFITAHKRVIGGRWLDLVNGGHRLRLNSADEAAAALTRPRQVG